MFCRSSGIYKELKRCHLINIANKKLPSPILAFIVYISYCAAGWFAARGNLAYYSNQMYLGSAFSHDAFAFFFGGVVPFAIYIAATSFIFKALTIKLSGGDVRSIKYGLHLTVITANLLLFALKFIYIAAPLYSALLEIMLDPLVTIAFVALYMWYAFKMEYVEKSRFRFVLTQVLGAFLWLYGLLAAVSLIISLM